MDRADLESFLAHGWDEAEARKRRHWAEVYRQEGPEATFRAAEAMRQHLRAVDPSWPSAEDRQSDLDHHLRLRRLLDRAAHGFSRR